MLNTQQLNINPHVSCYRTHSYVILISMLSVGTCEMLWKLCALMCSFFLLCAVCLDARYQKLTWFFSSVRRVTGTLKSKRSFGVNFCLFSVQSYFIFGLSAFWVQRASSEWVKKCFLPPCFSDESVPSVVPTKEGFSKIRLSICLSS